MVYILDFGSQYSQLIARRIRALGVLAELVPYDIPRARLANASGIILSGGPDSVYAKGAPTIDKKIFDLGIPILGICYGMQLMAYTLGGKVGRAKKREYGPSPVTITCPSPLFHGCARTTRVWMSHGDYITKLPKGFIHLARSPHSPDAAIGDLKRKLFGVQFHPEVEHTKEGMTILKNFVFRVARAKKDWDLRDFIHTTIREIKERVGRGTVICAVSGGVDSTVMAALVGRAIGKQLIPVFVDHGFLRQGEQEDVIAILKKRLALPLRVVNAQEQFSRALRGVTYGEEKRKIIGREFIHAFTDAVRHIHPRPTFLAQGTIHSDAVTSARTATGKKTALIKSHHNVGGLPKDLKLTLIEPLRDIFKDEVRDVGIQLGLPTSLVWRQPFPGPGLAVRIAGEITKEKLEILQHADAIVREEIERQGWQKRYYQYFAQLLSQKTVGVKGDERVYSYPIVIKIFKSSDVMTCDWARLPHTFLEHLSTRITNEVKDVTRILYDISTKPPATVEWE